MSEGMSMGQLTQISAWGLGAGTLFFSFFGIRTSRDFFLMMGLIACVLGNIAFAFMLTENSEEGANDTMVTLYVSFAALALYGVYCQFNFYREEGCDFDDEDDDDEESPETNFPEPHLANLEQVAAANRIMNGSSATKRRQ